MGEAKTGSFLSSCMSRTYLPVVDTTLLFASVPDRLGASRKDNYVRDVRADRSNPRSLPRSRGLGHRARIIKRWWVVIIGQSRCAALYTVRETGNVLIAFP